VVVAGFFILVAFVFTRIVVAMLYARLFGRVAFGMAVFSFDASACIGTPNHSKCE
jgi:hypothetical protein